MAPCNLLGLAWGAQDASRHYLPVCGRLQQQEEAPRQPAQPARSLKEKVADAPGSSGSTGLVLAGVAVAAVAAGVGFLAKRLGKKEPKKPAKARRLPSERSAATARPRSAASTPAASPAKPAARCAASLAVGPRRGGLGAREQWGLSGMCAVALPGLVGLCFVFRFVYGICMRELDIWSTATHILLCLPLWLAAKWRPQPRRQSRRRAAVGRRLRLPRRLGRRPAAVPRHPLPSHLAPGPSCQRGPQRRQRRRRQRRALVRVSGVQWLGPGGRVLRDAFNTIVVGHAWFLACLRLSGCA